MNSYVISDAKSFAVGGERIYYQAAKTLRERSREVEGLSMRRQIVIPEPLQPGDLVGVVAPSGPVEQEALDRGIEVVERLGFRVVQGEHCTRRSGYLAGTDEQRLDNLNTMLRSPEVRAILLARGGYGCMRILNGVDWQAAEADPKIVLGMSDATALQLALFATCGLVSLSGPMVAGQIARGLDLQSERSLVESLTTAWTGRDLLGPCSSLPRVVRPGRGRGTLMGGCLSMVTSLLGTPHAPDFSGAVLYFEDVNEPPYRLDRMLTQLKLAGVFATAAGLVLGHFLGSDRKDLSPEVERIAEGLTADRPIPILAGYPHGHGLPNLTIPCGATVELNADRAGLESPPYIPTLRVCRITLSETRRQEFTSETHRWGHTAGKENH